MPRRSDPPVPSKNLPDTTAPSSSMQLGAVRAGRLGDMLIAAGLLNQQKLDQALSMAKRTGDRLGDVLVKSGFVRPEEIAKALAQQFQFDFLPANKLSTQMVDRAAVKLVGVKVLEEKRLLPITYNGKPVLLLSDPLDTHATDQVEAVLGRRTYALTTAGAVEMMLQILAFETVDADRIIESARESIEAGEVKTLFQYLLGKAVLERASDVHIEPTGVALPRRR